MAHARLHIICGNCGSKDDMTFEINPKGHDVSEGEIKFEPAVFIVCENCGTLHDLNETIKEDKPKKEEVQSE